MRQRLGELFVKVARAGVEVGLEQRRNAPSREHLPHGGQRRHQFARMVRVIVHVDLPGGVDIEFETALHARERRQRPAQGVRIQRNPFGPGRAPYRGHGRHRIFDVDPARNAQRAAFDRTARHYDVIPVMASLEQLHVTGIEVARHVVRIAVHRNLRIVHHDVRPLLDDEEPAGAYLPHELRESLLHRLVRPVNVEVIRVGRRDHRHIGIEPQERTVELVGLDGQPPARKAGSGSGASLPCGRAHPLHPAAVQHQVAAEILRDTAQKSTAATRQGAVQPCHERRRRSLAVRPRHGHHVLAFGEVPQHLRALLDTEPVVGEIAVLAVLLRHCRGIHHHRRRRVEELRGDQPHVVLEMDRRPLGRQLVRQVRRRTVVTGHLFTLVQEIAGQGAHADAADTQKIYFLKLHLLNS